MTKRHYWTPLEDQILLKLIQERKIKKWTKIAATMNAALATQNRTGKQCRDRYVNKLSKKLIQLNWNTQEDKILIQTYRIYGGKWVTIAQQLRGRGDNTIKNRFYSRLRKTIRDLNKLTQCYLTSQQKKIQPNILSKVISIGNEKFKENSKFDDQKIQRALDLIEQLFWGLEQRSGIDSLLKKSGKILQNLIQLGCIKKVTDTDNQASPVSSTSSQPSEGLSFHLNPFWCAFEAIVHWHYAGF